VYAFVGTLLAMSLFTLPTINSFWKQSPNGFIPAMNFGCKTGLTRSRFWLLWTHIKFNDFKQSVASTGDRFYSIRYLVSHFNTTMEHFMTAGWVLCLDELMCPWLGLDSWHPDGMPHISKIIRKPKGVGLEFKCVADGETKIMLFLEIVEDSAVMQTKKYYNDEFGNTKKSSIATTLRMLEPWFSSGRLVVGDSWFASVQMCMELMKRGLYFTGIVKTAHREYPKTHFQTRAFDQTTQRGDWKTLHSEFDMDGTKVRLIAMAWAEPGPSKPDAPVKCFVGTAGSSIPTIPIERPRILVKPDGTCENTTRIIRQSAMIADYLNHCGAVDIHNHYRQGGLALELERTHDWIMRVFQTILGIMEVNSYLAFKSVTKMNVIHKDFVNSLAAELCHFLPSSCGEVETMMLQPQDMPGDERYAVNTQVRHEIVPASSLKSGAHGQCRVPGCLGDAYMVCKSCSIGINTDAQRLYFLCGTGVPKTGKSHKQCISMHIESQLLKSN
jgi:hypothetical protein